jgi:hypothetical protein
MPASASTASLAHIVKPVNGVLALLAGEFDAAKSERDQLASGDPVTIVSHTNVPHSGPIDQAFSMMRAAFAALGR